MITSVKLYAVACDYCGYHLEIGDSEAVFESLEEPI